MEGYGTQREARSRRRVQRRDRRQVDKAVIYKKTTEEECFQSAFHHEVVLVTDTTVDSFNVQSDEP